VALISFGDAWHNNRHAYPVGAWHGMKWYEIDFNRCTIWILKQFGLVSHIHRAELPSGNPKLRERNATACDGLNRCARQSSKSEIRLEEG
jgi:hypothetical protein